MCVRFVIANAAMAACLAAFERPLDWWLDASVLQRAGWLGVIVVAAALVYFVTLLVTGLRMSHLRHESG